MKKNFFRWLKSFGWLAIPLFFTACQTTSTEPQHGTSVVVFKFSNLESAVPRSKAFLAGQPHIVSVIRLDDKATLTFYIQNDAEWFYGKLQPGHYLVSSIMSEGGNWSGGGTWSRKLPTRLLFEIPETDKLYYLGNAAFSGKQFIITRDDNACLQFIKTLAGMKIPTGTEKAIFFLPGGKDASQRDPCSFDFINKINLTNEDE